MRFLKQHKWARRSIEVALVLVLLFSFRAYQHRDHPVTPPPINGQLINGESISLQGYQEKPLLVHFWATWCRICVVEQGSIENIAKNYPVLTIAMQSGNRQAMQNYMAENNLSFAVFNDPTGTVSRSWGVHATPSSFILDRNGEVRFTEVGYTTEWGLRLRLWLASFW